MNTKIIIMITLIYLSGCVAEVTKSDIQKKHSLHSHVNGHSKLMIAEGDLLSRAPYTFVAYQALRHDHRSFVVLNLKQDGEKKKYLAGDGFYLIDSDYLERSSIAELAQTLIAVTEKDDPLARYDND